LRSTRSDGVFDDRGVSQLGEELRAPFGEAFVRELLGQPVPKLRIGNLVVGALFRNEDDVPAGAGPHGPEELVRLRSEDERLELRTQLAAVDRAVIAADDRV